MVLTTLSHRIVKTYIGLFYSITSQLVQSQNTSLSPTYISLIKVLKYYCSSIYTYYIFLYIYLQRRKNKSKTQTTNIGKKTIPEITLKKPVFDIQKQPGTPTNTINGKKRSTNSLFALSTFNLLGQYFLSYLFCIFPIIILNRIYCLFCISFIIPQYIYIYSFISKSNLIYFIATFPRIYHYFFNIISLIIIF